MIKNDPLILATVFDFNSLLRRYGYKGYFYLDSISTIGTVYICIQFPFWNIKMWKIYHKMIKDLKDTIEQAKLVSVRVLWKRTWFGKDLITEIKEI